MIKLLGIFDIVSAIIFLLFGILGMFNILGNLVLLVGMLLLVKGLVFMSELNIASISDIICSVVMLTASFYHLNFIIIVVVSVFLFQKGVLSLFGR